MLLLLLLIFLHCALVDTNSPWQFQFQPKQLNDVSISPLNSPPSPSPSHFSSRTFIFSIGLAELKSLICKVKKKQPTNQRRAVDHTEGMDELEFSISRVCSYVICPSSRICVFQQKGEYKRTRRRGRRRRRRRRRRRSRRRRRKRRLKRK